MLTFIESVTAVNRTSEHGTRCLNTSPFTTIMECPYGQLYNGNFTLASDWFSFYCSNKIAEAMMSQ